MVSEQLVIAVPFPNAFTGFTNTMLKPCMCSARPWQCSGLLVFEHKTTVHQRDSISTDTLSKRTCDYIDDSRNLL
jgi:hypothetical protein